MIKVLRSFNFDSALSLQVIDVRRAQHRHVVEMLHMAKRPSASILTVIDSPYAEENFSLEPTLYSPARGRHKRKSPEVAPVAIEPCEDGVAAVATVLIQLPGGITAPSRLSLGSALILLSRVYQGHGSRAFLRRRGSSHQPMTSTPARIAL